MKAKLLFLFVFAALLAGCGKDKYTTKPQVEIKSVKQGEFFDQAGGVTVKFLEFDLTITDKEGDAQGEIIVDKLDASSPACPLNAFTESYIIPEFPSEPNQKVSAKVKYSSGNPLGYRNLSGNKCTPAPHIAIFRFRVVDKGGDTSLPVQSGPITLPF